MKNPKDRETTEREEMMCTECNTEGLESHPGYRDDDYGPRASLLKATRCPNEDCEYHDSGVPRDQIEMQMPDNSILDIGSLLGGQSSMDILTYAVVFGGLIFVAFSFGLIPTGDSGNPSEPSNTEFEVSGNLLSESSTDYSVSLYQNGTRMNTTSVTENGTYKFTSLSQGNYTVYLNTDTQKSPPGKNISISEDSKQRTVDFNQSILQDKTVDINQTVGQGNLTVNFSNPDNIRPINLQLSPVLGESVQRSLDLDSDRNTTVIMPDFPREQQFTIESNETLKKTLDNSIYEGDLQSYQIQGNANAKNIQLILSNQSSADVSKRNVEVEGSQTTEDITISSNETVGPVRVTISNGTSQDRKQDIGTWSGASENITLRTGTNNYTSGTLQVSPEPIKTNRSINGSISNGQIRERIQGNSQAKNATIEFLGGDANSALIGSSSISVDAENGSTGIVESDIVTIQESGGYRIEWNVDNARNQSLINYSYTVDGERTQIEDSGGTSLSLNENESISITAEAERKALDDTEKPPRIADEMQGDIDVDVSFEPSNPNSGDVVSPMVTLENEGSSDVEQEIVLYQNGEKFSSTQVSLSVGQTVELDGRDFGQPAVNKEGIHVFYINDVGPFFLNVGDVAEKFGVGNIQAEVLDVGARGEVNLDTNGDGTKDCKVLADGGICEIGSISTGEQVFDAEEVGVSNTKYRLNYTSIENPRDVKIDVGEDGLIDFENSGILDSVESTSVELPPSSTNVSIDSSNNIPVGYAFSWSSDSVVNNPVVDIDGNTVISDMGKFVEDRTFEVGRLTEGTYTFRFRSGSGGYEASIRWNEQEGQSFPTAVIDGTKVCQPQDFVGQQTCIVTQEDALTPGEHTIEFEQPPSDSFNYQIKKQERAFADGVRIDVDGQQAVQFFRPGLQPDSWEDVKSTTAFGVGDNNVDVTVERQNGIKPNVSTRLEYVLDGGAPRNLNVSIENGRGDTENIDISPSVLSSGNLVSETTIFIPEDDLSVGSNNITFSSDDGVFELRGNISVTESESVRLKTTD